MISLKKKFRTLLFLLPLLLTVFLFFAPINMMICNVQADQPPVICLFGNGPCDEVWGFFCTSDICDNGPMVQCLVCINVD